MNARQAAEFLDGRKPGWWRLIDVDRLDMTSPTDCIVGQLWGSWDRVDLLGIYHPRDGRYGYPVSRSESAFCVTRKELWVDEIDRRLWVDRCGERSRYLQSVRQRRATYERLLVRHEQAPLYVPRTWRLQEAAVTV